MAAQPAFVRDQYLIEELRNPGSDQRYGVNLIARPPAASCDQIIDIQHRLRSLEPDQYYYPRSDLHLTVVEICSGTTGSHANEVFERVCNVLPEILGALQSALLTHAALRFDYRAGSVVFQDSGTLNETRQQISFRLAGQRITIAPRYAARSAHVTFMRYLERLTYGWDELNDRCQIHGDWQLSEMWLTCGATWYGMKSRIKEAGPFKINDL